MTIHYSESRRVVITGMGVVSPVGSDVPTFWSRLVAGQSGITRLDGFDADDYSTRIAGTARDFDPAVYMDRKEIRQYDRYSQFAIAAARQAVEQAGLVVGAHNDDRVGVYIGSGIGGIGTLLDNHRTLLERGPKRVSPFFVPMMISNIAAGLVSIIFGAKGPNLAAISACATGNHAIGEAFHAIRSGRADAMIAGGAEAPITELALAGFCNMKAMSTRNDRPEQASRPFDLERDGFVMGEGAGILVLESLEHAEARGADVIGEIVGYGLSADAYHITAPDPDGDGACRAMRMALDDAGLEPGQVDYLNAHATGTPLGDAAETKAIKRLFGAHAARLAVSSTKSMTGHLFGAAGGIEAIASVKAIQEGVIPPTINYEYPDPECDLDYVPNQARTANVKVALSNGFGFGGHNAVLVFRSAT